ncbi:MAG: hypothetical protein QM656_00855 [Paracoccaceae bacterium]
MQEPRHPLQPEALRTIEQAVAYFTPARTAPTKPQPDLTPLEQMFAYYDAA